MDVDLDPKKGRAVLKCCARYKLRTSPVGNGLVDFAVGWPLLADIRNLDGQDCRSYRRSNLVDDPIDKPQR
ncbi:hypothetical protein RISK_004996 [Rhodopirellula islandica]|uniref:Uncharacterized protein n=1 Tax=Rhodopirellula islandica TaxID=595434 RepID=A0A0J1B993_RHOIS|nr:hypothetical protein RISK_004996 [Rhodopirellula islandica]